MSETATDTIPPNLTPDERERWEAAGRATPGPYKAVDCKPGWMVVARGTRKVRDPHSDFYRRDTENIALNADPATVRATLAELSNLRGRRGYTDAEYAEALDVLVKALEVSAPEMLRQFADRFPVIDEVEDFGPFGPVGQGLGRMGGHAVG